MLNKYLVPVWAMLSPSWCHDFALVFLFSNVQLQHKIYPPAYQCFTEALRCGERDNQNNQAYLPFIGAMVKSINQSLTSCQLRLLEIWLAQLPATLENQEAHVNLEIVLATTKEQIIDETLGLLAELPMAYPESMEDDQ